MGKPPEWFEKQMGRARLEDSISAQPKPQRWALQVMYWLDKKGWLPKWAGGGNLNPDGTKK